MRLELTHSFDIGVAEQVGVNKALLLKEILGWCLMNERNGINLHDGHHWTYNTAQAYADKFSYMTPKSIARWLRELEQDGWLFSGEFNAKNTDRTKSYRVDKTRYSNAANSPLLKKGHSTAQSERSTAQNETLSYTSLNIHLLGREGGAQDQFLSTDELQDLDSQSEAEQKEKSSAKKEQDQDGPVTIETAKRRAAVIAQMAGNPAPPNDEPAPKSARTPEDATEQLLAEIETDAGKRKLQFALGSAGLKSADEINLFAAVYRCAQHQEERRGTVPNNLWGKLPGYLKNQKNRETRTAQNQSNYANSTRPSGPYRQTTTRPIVSGQDSISVAEELLQEHLAGVNSVGW